MDKKELNLILNDVASHMMTPEDALQKIRIEAFRDISFAKIDTNRGLRRGNGEVIYGAGKTEEQIRGIIRTMLEIETKPVLITRLETKIADTLKQEFQISYDELSKIGVIGNLPVPDGNGTIVIATGGTSDIPVAQEAALTAEFLGNKVIRLYDVGVAGIHRILNYTEEIMKANVVIAIAGMEGALASVLGGIADCPVIAVPTSVGYGANFGGLSALLSMLNTCASGVSVVNIDNGYGAAYQASLINHLK